MKSVKSATNLGLSQRKYRKGLRQQRDLQTSS